MDQQFKDILDKQLRIAKELYAGPKYVERLKANYERLLNVVCTKHHTHDSVFYIQDCGRLGFRAIKFYNDSTDYRLGSFHAGMAEAYTEAICYM